jgi:phosphoribosylcarboxyaminoimidazole (NCAIR) mutase
VNAAILAAQILGVSDPDIRERIRQFKKDLAEGLKL